MHVLMIDDSPSTRFELRKVLEAGMPGAALSEAWDGKSAIQELAKGRVDFIVTDLSMPGVSGRQFLEILLNNPLLRRKKVLVFSKDISEELVRAFDGNPSVSFLEKAAGAEAVPAVMIAMMEDASLAEMFIPAAAAETRSLALPA